jgi:hypothetical protein
MTIQSIHTNEHSPQAILQRLDAVLTELLALRKTVQEMAKAEQNEDMVATLAGSLGPAQADELDYFNQFDVTWQRFADEPAPQ